MSKAKARRANPVAQIVPPPPEDPYLVVLGEIRREVRKMRKAAERCAEWTEEEAARPRGRTGTESGRWG